MCKRACYKDGAQTQTFESLSFIASEHSDEGAGREARCFHFPSNKPITTMKQLYQIFLSLCLTSLSLTSSFVIWEDPHLPSHCLHSSKTSDLPTQATVDALKADLMKVCSRRPKPVMGEVQPLVRELEQTAEQVGVGQASSLGGLVSGEWELVYTANDDTRSSPFFWAFSKAFPTNADQIYAITDSIPAPVKEVGPAFQYIDVNSATQTGRFVSKVKVATLGGLATSIMTTKGSIVGIEGLDGLKLKIETSKAENSTVLRTLFGPLGDVINANVPAFPSGEALERFTPGSSEVVMRTTYCDEGLRISRNDDDFDNFFVWRRRRFSNYDFL